MGVDVVPETCQEVIKDGSKEQLGLATALSRRSRKALLYCSILYYIILHYTILYYIILYYTILYYTIRYYLILYYVILYYIMEHSRSLLVAIAFHDIQPHGQRRHKPVTEEPSLQARLTVSNPPGKHGRRFEGGGFQDLPVEGKNVRKDTKGATF